jgi:glycosyltransferase involved in cell wall biosynthesis
VILTTRDRPRFLPIALACFDRQTYANRELIVVDDGDEFPADLSGLTHPATSLIRLKSGMPLGIKLNHGVDAARGRLCMKMDDDDWYAPAYLETSVNALLASEAVTCQPTVVFHLGFLFFELRTWQLRQSIENNAPGATLLFSKDDWRRRPFRPLPTDEDVWFYRDQMNAGARSLPVDSLETYVAIRHGGHSGTLGHTWTHQTDGITLEDYLTQRPLYSKTPEELLPDWALDVYRSIHAELAASGSQAAASVLE